uniref:Uncharacterized protein n=1 Tax=Meloidogyne enterolobii TaxID=390850 RepID=A0A6V7TSI9_MELEN|nr:unnamed protein product [Meloidogyne enterolobii]
MYIPLHMALKMLFILLLSFYFNSLAMSSSNSPMTQFQVLINSSVEDLIQPLNAFFETFFAENDSICIEQWDMALPSDSEREQMKELISFLMNTDDFDKISSDSTLLSRVAPLLVKSIQLTFIKNRFCVIHELLPPSTGERFKRFWGYLVLCSTAYCNSSRTRLHHSSPHFRTDGKTFRRFQKPRFKMKGDVCNQTAAIFERTGSRSLVVAGATRYSVRGNLTSSCQPRNAIADAAHNNLTMFHTMCVGVYEASNDGIFMQWHGQQSCPQSGAFISAGAKGSHPIYKEKGAYVNKLVSTVNKLAGENIATTPLQDRKCPLVASTNVFGRIVNGVGEENVCKGKAGPKNVTGNFIHIEQQRKWRDDWASNLSYIPLKLDISDPLDKCN